MLQLKPGLFRDSDGEYALSAAYVQKALGLNPNLDRFTAVEVDGYYILVAYFDGLVKMSMDDHEEYVLELYRKGVLGLYNLTVR